MTPTTLLLTSDPDGAGGGGAESEADGGIQGFLPLERHIDEDEKGNNQISYFYEYFA